VTSKEMMKDIEATLDIRSTTRKAQVLLLTQENAADFHSFGIVATTVGRKHIDRVKKHESLPLHDLLTGRHLFGV